MTAHTEPIGTPAEGVGGRRFRFDNHVIAVVGGIATAAITASATIIPLILEDDPPPPLSGSIEEAMPNANDTAITVAGTATPDVGSVLVTVGPRDSAGGLWADMTNVYGERWSLNIPTEPELPPGWAVKAWYRERAVEPVNGYEVMPVVFEDPPPPPPPSQPDQIIECVVVKGDSCVEGQPGWGSPSIYRSDH